jgi:hypothetical protein
VAVVAVAVVVAVEVEVEVVPGAGIEPRVMPWSVSCVEREPHLDPWARSCEAFSSSSRALVQLGLLPLAWGLASSVVGRWRLSLAHVWQATRLQGWAC